MKKLLALLLLLPALAFGQAQPSGAFIANGLTQTITANTSGNIPTPVQVTSGSVLTGQYWISNIGVNVAFVSHSATSALATTNCVVPTGTAQAVWTVLPGSAIIVTDAPNLFMCAITSSGTSILYMTPGLWQ